MIEEFGVFLKILEEVYYEMGFSYFKEVVNVFEDYIFEKDYGSYKVVKEFIGVSGFIILWNFLIN